jgi:hypothetical protein
VAEAQQVRRREHARDAIAAAMYSTYGQEDTDRSRRIADVAMEAPGDFLEAQDGDESKEVP